MLAESLAAQQPTVVAKSRPQEVDKERQKAERRLNRAIEQVEVSMAKLDEQIASLQDELSKPEHADDHVKLMELQAEIDSLQETHDTQAEEWLEMQEELETI